MSYSILFVIGALVALVVRWFFLNMSQSFLRQGIVGDASENYALIRQLKKDFRSLYVDQYVMKQGPMTYPRAFHRFASLFSLESLKDHPYLPNLILYVFSTGAFFALSFFLKKSFMGTVEDGPFLILVALFYFFSVSGTVYFGPAITYIHLTPRLLSRYSTAAAHLFISIYLVWAWGPGLWLSILFAVVAWHSSVFARQTLMFTWPLLALVFFRWEPVLALLGSLLLAFLIAPKYFSYSLEHSTFRYWQIYKTLNKQSATVQVGLSKFLSWAKIRDSFVEKDAKRIIQEVVFKEPIRTLFYYSEIFLLIYFCLSDLSVLYLLFPLLPTVVVWLVTSTEKFNHLGEAYRYFEYSLLFYLPIALAYVIASVFSEALTAPILVGYFLFTLLVATTSYWMTRKYKNYPAADILAAFLARIPLTSEDVVFPVSMKFGADICVRAACKALYWQPGGLTDPVVYKKYIEAYPYLRKDWKELIHPCNITYVIYEKAEYKKIPWEYDFSGLELVYESKEFIAMRIPSEMKSAT